MTTTKTRIRTTVAGDIPALQSVLDTISLFPGGMLPDMIAGFLDGREDAVWLTALQSAAPIGLCFARPEMLTDRTWNILALGVGRTAQRGGVGAALVSRMEDELRAHGARLVIIDTSGGADYAAARAFYAARNYRQVAVVPDYWADGDGKVTFAKRLG